MFAERTRNNAPNRILKTCLRRLSAGAFGRPVRQYLFALDDIPDTVFSLNLYWDHLLKSSPVHGVVHNGGWCDIGTPAGLERAKTMLRGPDV